ncbi:hypothetical protein [uncultured Chryseobacterium sp.]|uniref:hypothetical protein n=1 Tax=uncultured Chryseobacterium sp. TaxID=259322 RepID=UPI0025F41922|nr:hypothetical protein [uncultured Chryseobacterium sp.]
MARFITRIELHKADSDDYEILHQAMEREDFNKTIKSDDNTEYHLPDGEYFYNKAIPFNPDKKDYEIVLEKAKMAASKTKKSFSIITSRTDALKWHNLKKVE